MPPTCCTCIRHCIYSSSLACDGTTHSSVEFYLSFFNMPCNVLIFLFLLCWKRLWLYRHYNILDPNCFLSCWSIYDHQWLWWCYDTLPHNTYWLWLWFTIFRCHLVITLQTMIIITKNKKKFVILNKENNLSHKLLKYTCKLS